jgi:hypothetical protein
MLPPVLEVYVVWRDDDEGSEVADALIDRFHGTAFSGLIGGAIEVFARSEPWSSPDDAPRPLPFMEPLPHGRQEAELTVVVPVIGVELAGAVETSESWRRYLEAIAAARSNAVLVLPAQLPHAPRDGALAALLGGIQAVAFEPGGDREDLCRDICQAVAQFVAGEQASIRVFVSHTKHADAADEAALREVIERVRRAIMNTRLDEFFDASDLQPGRDWAPKLHAEAARSALLAVRTDLYATREWCQSEMLTAKRAGMPVVVLDVLGHGEERGSFLMDHVPRVPGRAGDDGTDRAILAALGQLVDECLKRALWRRQRELAERAAIGPVDWWAPHAPEPATLVTWLRDVPDEPPEQLLVLHPDPPLGRDERRVLMELAALRGLDDRLDILTPRGLAVRGG